MKTPKIFYAFIALTFLLSTPLLATTRYVTQTGSGNISGSSWGNSSNDLQAMINASSDGDEIWVKHGTYYPTVYPSGCSGCSSSRDYTFFMKSGVKIYGQFAGTESSITERVLGVGESVLSGDLTNDGINTNNAYHVVSFVGVYSPTTTLDCFTIKNGYANSNSTVTAFSGTGLSRSYNRNWGGGVIFVSSRGQLVNCSIVNNYATYGGGLLNSNSSRPSIRNSIFVANSAVDGAGIYNHNISTPSVIYTTIANNIASSAGGGMYNYDNSNPEIHNTIIWNNTSPTFSGIANNGSTPVVSSSIVQNGNSPCSNCPNTNGNANPLFKNSLDPDGPDNIWGSADDGLELSVTSPAIEAAFGTPVSGTDITGQVRHFDNPLRYSDGFFADIGAYENHDINPILIYVNGSLTTGANNGTSWANAFRGVNALQTALITSREGNHIWVAAGTYKPTAYPTGCVGCSSNRDFSFHLKDGIKLFGGFVGTETNINQRFLNTHETRLDGDINTIGDDTDNVRHVIVSVSDRNLTGLDGFTILNGGDYTSSGSSSINVESRELKYDEGGGIISKVSELSLSNIKIIKNRSKYGAGLFIYITYTDLDFENCFFSENIATESGGGAYFLSISSSIKLKRCIFERNQTSYFGGGFYSTVSNIYAENSVFHGNTSGILGGMGSAFFISQSNLELNHCTVSGNISNAPTREAIYVDLDSEFSFNNSIFWGNNDGVSPTGLGKHSSAIINAEKSIFEGGISPCISCPNTNGNIDPKFANVLNAVGSDNIWKTFDDGLVPAGNSPAINAGTVTPSGSLLSDIRNVSKQGSAREIGAYEFHPLHDCLSQRLLADKPLPSGTYQAGHTLLSNANINSGSAVTLVTSREIVLLPGFKAENGAVFTASIGSNCLSGIE